MYITYEIIFNFNQVVGKSYPFNNVLNYIDMDESEIEKNITHKGHVPSLIYIFDNKISASKSHFVFCVMK